MSPFAWISIVETLIVLKELPPPPPPPPEPNKKLPGAALV
jgi:hypothetical protein